VENTAYPNWIDKAWRKYLCRQVWNIFLQRRATTIKSTSLKKKLVSKKYRDTSKKEPTGLAGGLMRDWLNQFTSVQHKQSLLFFDMANEYVIALCV
jgi:hypothetical protein